MTAACRHIYSHPAAVARNAFARVRAAALIAAGLWLMCIAANAAQPFEFNRLTIKNGLSNGSVTCFLQDRRGFIWIGTSDGLNRYDGCQIAVYKHNPQQANSIGSNFIRCLYEDSENSLWIGTKGGGLSRMDPATGRITTFRHGKHPGSLSYDDVSGIVEDGKGNLWIAVDRGGLDRLDPRTGVFTNYPPKYPSGELLNNALTDIALDGQNTIWLTSWGGGVYCFDIRTETFAVHPLWKSGAYAGNIFDIHIDSRGIVWIASGSDGIYALDITGNTCTQYACPGASVHFSAEDREGNLWIATPRSGICILDRNSGRFTRIAADEDSENGLLSNLTNCIYRDGSGSVWIGTSSGVNFYNPLTSQFGWISKRHRNPVSLSDKGVFALLKDRRNCVWVGGINCIDRISPGRKSIRKGILPAGGARPFHLFQSFCEAENGIIWIGTYADFLIRYDPAADRFSQIKIPAPAGMNVAYRNVHGIYEDGDHTLWLSTELGAVNYNPSTGAFTPLFESNRIIYPEEKTHVVYRDRAQELWVGTEAGLRRYSRDMKAKATYRQGDSPASVASHFITAIHEDAEGTFWIGTMGGLHRFDREEERFELIRRPDLDYGDPVFGLCEDRKGILWMTTSTGIIKFNPKDRSFQFYDESDGLQNRGFHKGAFFQAADGELLFGGKDGFNTFYPDELKINGTKPPVVITDFQIFNHSVLPEDNGILTRLIGETDRIRIKHSQSVISFQFVALNFVLPSKNRYRYKMEGFDQDWIPAHPGQRSATYTNLNPGEYTFLVKASNNDGVWNETPASLHITIQPPFWQTGYAYALYFAVACGLICLLISYFTIRERDRNSLAIAKLEAKQIREIDDMKFNLFTNISHEFRTPLSLILGPLTRIIEKKSYRPEEESLYVLMLRNSRRLLRLINQLLDFRKIEAGKLELHMKYDDIIRFITELTSTFIFYAEEKNIQYITSSSIANSWVNFDPDKLDKILYNLISNAFQYTPEGGRVEVNLSETIEDNRKYICIQVSDTGIGIAAEEKEKLFTAFYQGKRRKILRNEGSGIGLTLTKELVDLYQGKISVESHVEQGAVFTVLLPVNEEKPEREVLSIINHTGVRDEDGENPSPDTEAIASSNLILVVEDNADMRMYLKRILSDRFKVLAAKDGEDALRKASEYIPDLIISDVMMPAMDGLELLRALRKNDHTNHIPIILLTAKYTESHVLEGYKTGADDYITKPFSEEMLKIRIENILASRKKLWEQYRQSKDTGEYGEKLSESPRKQAFIEQTDEIVHRHIANPYFGIETLAEELGMSLYQLFRKTKALMDSTPYGVIQQIRMTRAARLMMAENDLNMSEIAFAVGYQELSNFSRAFKKYYNLSPRDYHKKMRAENPLPEIDSPPADQESLITNH
ncbi:MAG: response regulator [Tannerella sp.]|jgi:signal transduction histidine kinase/ligand-binding sensor domain-containing protein/DNA-binding NarL/FixJ family response regulator|nr:response regulator [Tannerella sp.]